MAINPVNIGSGINAGDGEAIRSAFQKINAMMAEIYAVLTTNGIDGSFLLDGDTPLTKLENIATGRVLANLSGGPSAPLPTTLAALAGALPRSVVEVRSSASTVVAADVGKTLDLTGTWTLALAAAAAVGNGFVISLRNYGLGIITIDPSGSETIDGAATITIPPLSDVVLTCDGTLWRTLSRPSQVLLGSGIVAAGSSQVPIALLAGYASYRLVLRYFEPAATAGLSARFATDGVPTFISAATYRTSAPGLTQNNTSNNQASGGSLATAMLITSAQLAASGWASTADLLINPGATSRNPGILGTSQSLIATNGLVQQSISNSADLAARATHIQLYYTATTISAGEWELYGLRK